MKEKVFKEEMKGFNISIDDIEPSDDIFGAIEKTIIKMRNDYLIDRLEVILNGNLIECKDKITNFRTILGCRVSYDNLPKDVSFIVRKDEKPTYEKLEKEIERLNNIINHLVYHIYYHEEVDELFEQVFKLALGKQFIKILPIEEQIDIEELKEGVKDE